MKIRTKLLAGFVASAALVGLVGAIATWTFTQLASGMYEISQFKVPEVRETSMVATRVAAFNELSAEIYARHLGPGNPAEAPDVVKAGARGAKLLTELGAAMDRLETAVKMDLAAEEAKEREDDDHQDTTPNAGVEGELDELAAIQQMRNDERRVVILWTQFVAADAAGKPISPELYHQTQEAASRLLTKALSVQDDAGGEINEALESVHTTTLRARLWLLVLAGVAFVSALGIGMLVAGPILRRLRELTAGMVRFGEGDLDSRIPISRSRDELAHLAETSNSMAENLNRSQHELIAAKEVAEAASIAKSAFLANMSHEIRTPIGAIVGYADMMLEPDQSSSDRAECLQVVRRNSKHLLELIGDILDISKIEAEKMSVERIPCDLAQISVDVVSLCRARAIEKGLSFSLTFGNQIPKQINSDPLRLKQVLMNLINNAIKFTRTGGIRLHVSLERPADAPQSRVRFDIADSGIGISPQEVERLFQPFAQADNSTSRRFGGTGLGLIISKRLAELMGGGVFVQSTPGIGSTFSFTIDPGLVEATPMLRNLEESMMTPAIIAPRRHEVRLKGRILLAEDGPDNQLLISAQLRRAGAEVIVAGNGRIAVEKATSEAFDLIFMDMQMPELDGYGATSELRQRGWTGPIVALTAHALTGDREKCLKAGCTEYLSKPVDRDLLISTAALYLKQSTVIVQAPPEPRAPSTSAAGSDPATPEPDDGIVRSAYSQDDDMRDVLAEFVERLPAQVARLVELSRDQSLDDLCRLVHQIKGAGGGFGFPTMTRLAAQAESSLRTPASAEVVHRDVEALIELIRQVEGYDASKEQSSVTEAPIHRRP